MAKKYTIEFIRDEFAKEWHEVWYKTTMYQRYGYEENK